MHKTLERSLSKIDPSDPDPCRISLEESSDRQVPEGGVFDQIGDGNGQVR